MPRSVKRNANILRSQCIRLAAITAVVLANLSTSVGLDWVLDKNGQIKWASKCDFDGVHLIKSFKGLSEEECGSRCIALERCTHVNMIGIESTSTNNLRRGAMTLCLVAVSLLIGYFFKNRQYIIILLVFFLNHQCLLF